MRARLRLCSPGTRCDVSIFLSSSLSRLISFGLPLTNDHPRQAIAIFNQMDIQLAIVSDRIVRRTRIARTILSILSDRTDGQIVISFIDLARPPPR